MKKYLFALVAGFIPALATTNTAVAQNSNAVAVLHNDAQMEKMYKADLATETVKSNTVSLATVNSKALKNFNKFYKNAGDARWYFIDEGFNVQFNNDGVKNSIYYNKKGYWTGSLKTYNESKLAKDLRAMIKREYFDFSIYQVQEILTMQSQEMLPTYVIYMEDNKSYKTLLVYDNEIKEWQNFIKY
ncbi:MAG: hypothetical protein JWR61_1232 [Ferruginibacter sp.]|jgi:hypothetical protein|uniref:hypothetical protein n=1 Tax=Ferruginibacter sp. TaxID=1940288 RepID=UPI00265B5C82|nr:hypothetical protein [Ferruginibacter sp.]MDB5276277.1 hypothetical protein [Ferruginibacter sp.]